MLVLFLFLFCRLGGCSLRDTVDVGKSGYYIGAMASCFLDIYLVLPRVSHSKIIVITQ